MKILIVKLSAIGDVIHTLPALNALRRRYPHARIDWVIEAGAAGLVTGHPAVDRVLISERKRWLRGLRARHTRSQSLQAMGAFIRRLRATRYDLVIDFQQLLKSGVLVWLARGAEKAGFDRGMAHMEESHLFLNRRIPPVSMEIHALRRYLMLLAAVGIPTPEVVYGIPDPPAIREAVRRRLPPDAGKRRIAVNPVAQWPTKLWSSRRFARLADRLAGEWHAEIVFTGGPEDRPVISEIRSAMTRESVNLAGETSLKELAALYRMVDLVISTDTGPMHLAAAVDTPVVAVFGPTAPWRTGPYGPGHRVVRSGVPCSPCFKRTCYRGDHICMERITVNDVAAAAAAAFSEPGHPIP